MKTFRSKIGLEIYIPVAIIILGTGLVLALEEFWAGLILAGFLTLFIGHILLTTYYQVANGTLRIKCGFFMDKEIEISDIKEIRPTRNPISSPANSLDRLSIKFRKYESIIVSPKDKKGFISELRKVNPQITILENKRNK